MSIDWQVHTYASLESTQDYVKELAAEDFPEGTVIQCLMQTKGRGRHGNDWHSPIGNLYMSALLRPDCTANEAGQLSFVVAVALSAAIDDYLEDSHVKTLKWPNDILIDGKKCAGILLESELTADGQVKWLVFGVGVNIMAPPKGAVGLQEVSWEIQVPIHPFRDVFIEKFKIFYKQWRKEGFAPIREVWLSQAHGKGEAIKVRLPDRELTGIFTDLDENGALLLRMNDGKEKTIHAGEVFFGSS